MARGGHTLQASVELQACWGGFLGSDYPFPTDIGTSGGFGGSFAPAGPNQFGFAATPVAGGGMFPMGFADVPEYGVLTPLAQRDAPTGLFGYGTLQFPPREALVGSPFFQSGEKVGAAYESYSRFSDFYGGLPASGLCYRAPFFYGSFDPGLPPSSS